MPEYPRAQLPVEHEHSALFCRGSDPAHLPAARTIFLRTRTKILRLVPVLANNNMPSSIANGRIETRVEESGYDCDENVREDSQASEQAPLRKELVAPNSVRSFPQTSDYLISGPTDV